MQNAENPENTNIEPRQAAERFIKHHETEVSQATIRGRKTPVYRFAEWVEEQEGRELHNLNGLDVQAFYDSLKDDENLGSLTTLKNYMVAVRLFLRFLERMEVVPEGLSEKVHTPTLDKNNRKRDEEIRPDRVKKVVRWLEKYKYGSRDHVLMLILWRTGLRRGAVYSLDVEDFTTLDSGEPVVDLQHRPEQGTPLKNGVDGERPVNLKAGTAEAIQDFIDMNRVEVEDEYGRRPLFSSVHGRWSASQMRRACLYYTCPEVTGIGDCSCESEPSRDSAVECEKSRSPHVIRAASITYWRRNDVPVDVVSDRMNVSRDVIEEHYDRRTEEGKARQRRKFTDSV